MNPKELLASGQLNEAIDTTLSEVKKNPNDKSLRFFLAELLCFRGEWERADRQLDSVVQQAVDASLLALLFRQLIRAEIIREQVFADGRAPELVVPLSRDAEIQLELNAALRADQESELPALVTAADQHRVEVSGECNEQAFAGIRDLDDRIAGVLEVLTATGKYFWVPWHTVKTLEFARPERPMDLIWRKASIDVEGGPEGEVYVPTRYPLPHAEGWDDAMRLGRATDWQGEEPSAVRGKGLRMLLIGDEAKSIMDLVDVSTTQDSLL